MANKSDLIPSRGRGRPSKAVAQLTLVEQLLDSVASGTSLEEACKAPGMPTPTAFRRMVRKDKELQIAWHQARHDYAHSLFDKMTDLAGYLARTKFKTEDNAQVTAIRTSIDAYKHITARLAPEVYAEQKPGNQGVIVNIVTSLPLGPGSIPEEPIDTTFRIVGKIKE